MWIIRSTNKVYSVFSFNIVCCVRILNEQRKEYRIILTNLGCLYELNLAWKQKFIKTDNV